VQDVGMVTLVGHALATTDNKELVHDALQFLYFSLMITQQHLPSMSTPTPTPTSMLPFYGFDPTNVTLKNIVDGLQT
jgi:hypothetical protein